ncbi:Syntaxin family protein [Corchorus olitorius]|uniref:Syntaxin family protein n=1 Tax=Corchorus olitorius TaxID=93759 RepID=A0A1R3L1C4_9ROSI|nr:Syntaxin family protein [Corchorus olitorius]
MQAEAILLVDAQQQRCPGGRQPVGLGQRLGLEAGAAQQRQHHIGQIEEDQGDGGQHGQATGQYRTPYQAILQGPPAPPPAQCRRVESLITSCDRKVTANGRPEALRPGRAQSARRSVAQGLQGLLHHRRRQGNVAVLDHGFLAAAREDQPQEFPLQGIERTIGRLVHIDVEIARQGIAPGQGVRLVVLDEIGGALACQRQGVDAGGLVADARVADAPQGLADGLDHRGRARLFVDVGAEVATAQRRFLEVAVGARHRIAAESLDRPPGPVAGQAQVAPGSAGAADCPC